MGFVMFLFFSLMQGHASTAPTDATWPQVEYILDNYRLIVEVPLTSTPDEAIIGSVNQIVYNPGKGHVLVLDSWSTKRVSVFDTSGNFIQLLGRRGEGPGEYQQAYNLICDGNGHFLVFDVMSNKLSRFDADYRFVEALTFEAPERRRIFPGQFQQWRDVFLLEVDRTTGAKTKLLFANARGLVIGGLKDSWEALEDHFNLQTTFQPIDDYLWVGLKMQTGALVYRADRQEPREVIVKGYAGLVDPELFDLKRQTYDGKHFHDYVRKTSKVSQIININNQFVAIGPLIKRFVPEGEDRKPVASDRTAEEWEAFHKPYLFYFDIYTKSGDPLQKGVALEKNIYPLAPATLFGGHDPQHIFLYAWREESEENPVLYLYRWKGGTGGN